MLSFINLGRKIIFFKFCDIIVSEVKGEGARWKPSDDFLSKVNSNYMPIWYRFQDIGPFNNLLIKLISLITMAWSGWNSMVGHTWVTG